MGSKIVLEESDNTILIKFNRGEKLNALDMDMWVGLAEVLEDYREDKIAILTGSGDAFSVGDDIYMMYNFTGIDEAEYFVTAILYRAINAFLDYRLPIISAVDGYALGGGCEITLLTDIVVASPNSTFGVPEVKIGLLPPIMLSLGAYMIGFKRAYELSLTGRFLSTKEAFEIGLVDVISEDPIGKAYEIAEELSKTPKETLFIYKDYVNKFKQNILKDSLTDQLALLMTTTHAKKLMEDFIKKRLDRKTRL